MFLNFLFKVVSIPYRLAKNLAVQGLEASRVLVSIPYRLAKNLQFRNRETLGGESFNPL